MKYFSYFIFDDWPGLKTQTFVTNKPTHYLLDHGNYTADNAIFKNSPQNIEPTHCDCVARSSVLLKPNVANIIFLNFCEQKFLQPGPIIIAIDCNGRFLFIFEENSPNYASGPKSASNSGSFWVRRLFSVCVRVFCAPKCDNFACLHTRQDRNELHLQMSGIFYKSITGLHS